MKKESVLFDPELVQERARNAIGQFREIISEDKVGTKPAVPLHPYMENFPILFQ